MKFHDILNSAATNLWHNKGRTFLTIIAVLIGSLTISITLGINTGVNNYLRKQIGNVGNTEQMIIGQQYSSSTSGAQKYSTKKSSQNADEMMTKKDVQRIKSVEGLKNIKALKDSNVEYAQGKSKTKYLINAQVTLGIKYDLQAGHQVATSGNACEILLTKEMAKAFGYRTPRHAINHDVNLVVFSPILKRKMSFLLKLLVFAMIAWSTAVNQFIVMD